MPRISLPVKILLLAFLNVILLGFVFLIFARIQLRIDLSSFLLAPARDRILSVSRLVGLQLPNASPSKWSQMLDQYAAIYPATFYLFAADGSQLAGKRVSLPDDLLERIRRVKRHFDGPRMPPPPPEPATSERGHGPPPPPLIFVSTSAPQCYWVGVHIPIWMNAGKPPVFATLVWRFSSLWTNTFFFDYKPWLAVVICVIAVSLICWVPLIRGLTRAISQLTRATEQIADGHFEFETRVHRRDELGRLSDSIGRMARRLSGFVHGQRRFLGDIAHELCSPIARIQVGLSILEQRAAREQMDYVKDVQEEVEHMSALVNELLSFSKTQMGAAIDLSGVNVADTVRRVIQREASGQAQVEAQINERLRVLGQPDYVFRSVANVVRNAIRYAGHAGPVVISAEKAGDSVSITVADNGPGVPESELEEIFKPFYRPDSARQRDTGGTGLGLAIVKNCIEACGGTVECRNRSPQGLEVELRLPVATD